MVVHVWLMSTMILANWMTDSCFALFLMTLDFLGQHMIIVKLAWGAECLDDLQFTLRLHLQTPITDVPVEFSYCSCNRQHNFVLSLTILLIYKIAVFLRETCSKAIFGYICVHLFVFPVVQASYKSLKHVHCQAGIEQIQDFLLFSSQL